MSLGRVMLIWRAEWRPVALPKFLPTIWGLTMAYAERRERKKGVRYRGLYKGADGRYRSAGTFSTEERALAVAREAERHALVAGDAAGGLDPGIRATRTIREYAPLFLRHHQVEGNTKDTYAGGEDSGGDHGSHSCGHDCGHPVSKQSQALRKGLKALQGLANA
jgi:hypothetical protein